MKTVEGACDASRARLQACRALSIRKDMFVLFILWFVCVILPIAAPKASAEESGGALVETFAGPLGAGWSAFTNDEYPANGWQVTSGTLVQSVTNSDSTPYGERFLVKTSGMPDSLVGQPFEAWVDIFPYDFAGMHAVWYGLCLFVDSSQPDRGEVVVALYKDPQLGESGLQIAVGGYQWLTKPNNATRFLWHWNRIRVRVERDGSGGAWWVRAKTWIHGEPEPSDWMTSASLPLDRVNLAGRGVGLGCNAMDGLGANPSALFDNLLVRGRDSSQPALLPERSAVACRLFQRTYAARTLLELREWVRGTPTPLAEMVSVNRLVGALEALEESFPDFAGDSELAMLHVKGLRRLGKWDVARARANQIPIRFPGSALAARMGGIGGRSEEQAAIDFALIMKAYHAQRFRDCATQIDAYLENYPSNWRIPDVYQVYAYALFHAGEPSRFMEFSRRFLEDGLNPQGEKYVKGLRAETLVKTAAFEEGRQAVRALLADPKNEELRGSLEDLLFESYAKPGDYASLVTEASSIAAQHAVRTPEWAQAMLWLGIGRARLASPDWAGSAQAFEAVVQCEELRDTPSDPKRTKAAFWRVWLADQRGDTTAARTYMSIMQTQLPDSPTRTKALEQYRSYLQQP